MGRGIGKGQVTRMHGSVSVESEVGKGTTIHCFLEVAQSLANAKKTPSKLSVSYHNAAPLDILIAEDDNVSRFALRAFLNRAGHRTGCVDDGTQALEALQLYPCPCLFTDIQMPGMDGLDLTARVRQGSNAGVAPSDEVRALVEEVFPGCIQERPVPREIAIVAVSAHAMSGDKERFLQQGMDYYISKPIIAEELYTVLEELSVTVANPNRPAETEVELVATE